MKWKGIILIVCLVMALSVNVLAFAFPFFGVVVDSWCTCKDHNGYPGQKWEGDGCCISYVPENGACSNNERNCYELPPSR